MPPNPNPLHVPLLCPVTLAPLIPLLLCLFCTAPQRTYREAYDNAVADLRYGAIAVNCPGLVAFAATKLVWGGYPGSTPQVGWVGSERMWGALGGVMGRCRRRCWGVVP